MGMFWFHRCKKYGCASELFVPEFAKDKTDDESRASWGRYVEARKAWIVDPGEVDGWCPKHAHVPRECDLGCSKKTWLEGTIVALAPPAEEPRFERVGGVCGEEFGADRTLVPLANSRKRAPRSEIHAVECSAAQYPHALKTCRWCSTPFRITSEAVTCGSCCALWIAQELYGAAGWTGDEDGNLYPPAGTDRKLTGEMLDRMLGKLTIGELALLRLKGWSLPKDFASGSHMPGGFLLPEEPVYDLRRYEWGLVKVALVNPFSGDYLGRAVAYRVPGKRWRASSASVLDSARLEHRTLLSRYHDRGRTLVAVTTGKRAPDKLVDREVSAQLRAFMRKRLPEIR